MITNRDIETAFVRAQKRINEEIENAQAEFVLPDVIELYSTIYSSTNTKKKPATNENNPLANEEI